MLLSRRKRMVLDSICLIDCFGKLMGFGVFVGVETEQMSIFSESPMINAQTPPCLHAAFVRTVQYMSNWGKGSWGTSDIFWFWYLRTLHSTLEREYYSYSIVAWTQFALILSSFSPLSTQRTSSCMNCTVPVKNPSDGLSKVHCWITVSHSLVTKHIHIIYQWSSWFLVSIDIWYVYAGRCHSCFQFLQR